MIEQGHSHAEDGRSQTPAERTLELLQRPLSEFTAAMQGREVVLLDEQSVDEALRGNSYPQNALARIRLDRVSGWSANTTPAIGQQYVDFQTQHGLQPGDWYARRYAKRIRQPINQSIITAQDEEKPACLRVERASRFNRVTGTYVPMKQEGAIADTLGFADGDWLRLMFLNDSEVLYLVPEYYPGETSEDPMERYLLPV